MNREEYTQLMIDKSKTIAANDLKKVEKFAKKLSSMSYLPPDEFADHIIMECFKKDGVRPEYFLDKTQTPSKILFSSEEKQVVFANRVAEYQESEAVVKELSKHNKVNSVNNSNIVNFSNESMIFNPEYVDDYHTEYLKEVSDKTMFVVAGEKPKALEYTDKYSLFDVKPTQNEISIVVKPDSQAKTNSSDDIANVDVANVDVPEVEYPLQKSDAKVKSYQDYVDELLVKYESNYSLEKLSKTGLKQRLFNAETGGSIHIEKSVLGSVTLTAGTGTAAEDLATMLLKGKGRLVQVPSPETEEDFTNMIEAWKKLQSDGYDLANIKLDKEGVPQRYHDALAELKKPGYVIGGEELNNDIEEPAKSENSFVVVDDNPFESEGETPETPKNEGDVPQEPKHQEKQEQQVDDNPFEGENAVKAEQAKEPEKQIVDDNPFEGENAVNEPQQPDQQSDELDIDFDDFEFDDEDEVKNQANQDKDFDPDFDDALADAVNGIDPNSDEAVEQRAIQQLQSETGTNPNSSQKTHQQQAKKAKLR
ncbi:hypothetical protein J7974_15890 [Vibrio parahaemolyticus]|uniref:hypothetical protein n=1 Tax=Vibrio parahaemolyticus TaxID=670 RepID=UPI001375B1C0|nr:hypothetical protein [Vibrio parahaemolyticus]MBM5246074.1 hypothetical protein [Vibrio parahaemolyticus]MBM5253425.1 hypothetical protein [Vibrio parahaemolyticus]MBM5299193.1 hypothetical protein [Vibrio parahaemolyticus]MBM5302754.1 hypothetical protein [Vibrio parahaemolyticus]MBM5309273.1 hypothetical protein [Vibrio parahaemolyticus]